MRFTCDSTLPLTMAVSASASAVEAWLGQQLEMRGIDAMIYSRYILSLLQQDEPDPIPLSPPAYPAAARPFSLTDCAAVAGAKSKNRSRKVEKRRSCDIDLDEQRKMAAIKCLLSATDETSDIESFVDELYMKLKEVEPCREGASGEEDAAGAEPAAGSPRQPDAPLEDPAQRYYAAFPALSDRCSNLTPTVGASNVGDKVWAKVACTPKTDQSDTDSEDRPTPDIECTPENDKEKNVKSKKEKDLYNLASKYTGRFSPRHPGTGKSSPKGQKDRQASVKKTPPHINPAFHSLPGVESPKFKMYTFKGKSIDHIKGKSLFQDVEGDIGPPAISVSKSNKSAVFEYCPDSSDASAGANGKVVGSPPKVPSPPPFILPMMKSPRPNAMATKMDQEKRRQPLYLRRSSIDHGSLPHGGDATDDKTYPTTVEANNQIAYIDSATEEQASIVEDVWMGKQSLADMFPQPDANRPRLYERNVDKIDRETKNNDGESVKATLSSAVGERRDANENQRDFVGFMEGDRESIDNPLDSGEARIKSPRRRLFKEEIDEFVRDLVGFHEESTLTQMPFADTGHVTEEPWMSEHAIEAVNQYHRGVDQGKRLFTIGKSTDSVQENPSQGQLSDWFNESFDMQPFCGHIANEEKIESFPDYGGGFKLDSADITTQFDINKDMSSSTESTFSCLPSSTGNGDDKIDPGVVSRRKEVEHRHQDVKQNQSNDQVDYKTSIATVDSSASIEIVPEVQEKVGEKSQTEGSTVKELVFRDEAIHEILDSYSRGMFTDDTQQETEPVLSGIILDSSASLSTAATEVPPNTPVNLQDFSTSYGSQANSDILGLSSLIQLAEQIKSLSQEDSDVDFGTAFFSQELPLGTLGGDHQEIASGEEEGCMVAWESLESIADDDYLSPGEIVYPIAVAIDTKCGSAQSPDVVHSFMQLFDSPSSSSGASSCADTFSDIPTPLSSEEDESMVSGSTFSHNIWQSLSRGTHRELDSADDCAEAGSEADAIRDDNVNLEADDQNVSKSGPESTGKLSPAMFAVQLGHTEMLKKMDTENWDSRDLKMGKCNAFDKETRDNQNANTSTAILSNHDQKLVQSALTSPGLKAASLDDSVLVLSAGKTHPSAMYSAAAKRSRSASCDIQGPSRLQVWWELTGKSKQLWTGRGGSTGILTGELKDFLWQEKNNFWKMKENGVLEGVVLKTSPVDGGNGILATSPFGNNGVVLQTPPGNGDVLETGAMIQSSPLREYFSPKVQRGESRIWDVNVPGKFELAGSFDSTFNMTPASITQILGQLSYAASRGIHMTFIEGGLYGKEWKELLDSSSSSDIGRPLSTISDRHSDTASVKLPEDKYWGSSSEYAQSDDDDISVSSSSCITNTTDILPSENSAFCEFARSDDEDCPSFRRLHQVQSEPIISPMKHCTQGLEATYRLIQVKHLYKSDTSILRQLGLASGNDDEETQQTDTVEFSPDRHFRPISTLLSLSAGQGHVSPAETVSDTVTVVAEDVYTEKESLDGSWNGSYTSSFLRSSSYQLYMEKGQLLEESNDGEEYFVPSFRVEKKCEKFAQTGDTPVEQQDEPEVACECSLTQRLLTDMKKVLGYDDAAESENLTLKDFDKSIHNDLNSSDYESMGQDTSGDEISDYQPTGIAGIWEQTSHADTSETTPVAPDDTHRHTNVSASRGSRFQSIWSVGLESNIALVLQVSETGHQSSGAATIQESSLQGEALLDAYAAAIDNFEDYLYQDYVGTDDTSHARDDVTSRVYGRRTEPEWMREDVVADVFTDEEGDLMFALEVPQRDVPATQRLYSSDLENEWRTHSNNFTVQVPKYNKPKNKLGGGRKPCSFYMEGNCRRADCKFAHDVSTITCRFWEEGECFKGVTCPFLHGYYRESPKARKKERRRNSAKSGSYSSNNREEFTLRNDDFPALSQSQDAATESGVTSSAQGDNRGVARPIPAKSNNVKDRSKVKAKSLPIDIKFKTKSATV